MRGDHVHVLIADHHGCFSRMAQSFEDLLKVEQVGLGSTAVFIAGHHAEGEIGDACPCQSLLGGDSREQWVGGDNHIVAQVKCLLDNPAGFRFGD